MFTAVALYLTDMLQTRDLAALDSLLSRDPAAATKILRKIISEDELVKGSRPLESGMRVLFAIQLTPGTHEVAVTSESKTLCKLKKLDDNLYAAVRLFKDGEAYAIEYQVDGKALRSGLEVELYDPNPSTQEPSGGMKGELRDMGEFRSTTFQGTTRHWFLYLPPNLDPAREYPLLVGQDAQWDRQWMANALENCAHAGRIPATVGVFLEPGQDKPGNYSNRSLEYDSLNANYTKLLVGEVLPEVEKLVRLDKNPSRRAIAGMSSGGICSFTACWERPDSFGAAISFVGSFANISSGETRHEGGHNYPFLLRKSDKKPIRVFLQDGSNDLDNQHGNWWLCNQQMAAALKFKDYDVVWVPGHGFHNTKHARRLFDQALVWWLGKLPV